MNRNLLLLNGLAIIAVVSNHSAGYGNTALFYWTARYQEVSVLNFDQVGTASYWLLVVLKQLTLFSVPAFIFVSGAFMAYAGSGPNLLQYKTLRARLSNMIFPYLLWSVLYLIYNAVSVGIRTPGSYLTDLLLGSATPAFFFVIAMIQLTLLSPFLVAQCKRVPVVVFWIGLFVEVVVIAINYYIYIRRLSGEQLQAPPAWLFTSWFFYFCCGILFFQNSARILKMLERFKPLMLGLLIVAAIATMVETEFWVRKSGDISWMGSHFTLGTVLYAVLFLLCYVTFVKEANLPFRNFFYAISGKTYGIYLVHLMVLEIVARAVYHFCPFLLPFQFIFQPLLIAAGVGIPYAAIKILSGTQFRRYNKYIFG